MISWITKDIEKNLARDRKSRVCREIIQLIAAAFDEQKAAETSEEQTG